MFNHFSCHKNLRNNNTPPNRWIMEKKLHQLVVFPLFTISKINYFFERIHKLNCIQSMTNIEFCITKYSGEATTEAYDCHDGWGSTNRKWPMVQERNSFFSIASLCSQRKPKRQSNGNAKNAFDGGAYLWW